MAVLYDPTLFCCKAPAPKALFPLPSVLFQIAFKPTPTFELPVVFLISALVPIAVLLPPVVFN